MSLIPFTAVHGTWGFDGDPSEDEWSHPRSRLSQYLGTRGFQPLPPFYWTGAIDGVRPWIWTAKRKHLTWQVSGLSLKMHLHDRSFGECALLTHSHGGQVALYAAAQGLHIPILVTFMMPVRSDMAHIAEVARPNIGHWIHLHTDSDALQLMGEFFDGAFGIVRRARWTDMDGKLRVGATNNLGLEGVGHSRMLTDPSLFHWWDDSGLIGLLHRYAQEYH